MAWVPAAGSIVGALGSLFGGNSNRGQSVAAGNINGIAGNENALGQGYLNSLNGDQSTANRTTGQLENYLEQDPYTASNNASAVANATNGMTNAYNQARASLTSNLASRGISGPSSQAAGALTGLESARLGQVNAADNSLEQAQVNNTGQRLSALDQVAQGQAGTDYSRGLGAEGAALGGYQTEFGDQQTLSNDENSGLGGVGSAFGALGGVLGRGGIGSPSASTASAGGGGAFDIPSNAGAGYSGTTPGQFSAPPLSPYPTMTPWGTYQRQNPALSNTNPF